MCRHALCIASRQIGHLSVALNWPRPRLWCPLRAAAQAAGAGGAARVHQARERGAGRLGAACGKCLGHPARRPTTLLYCNCCCTNPKPCCRPGLTAPAWPPRPRLPCRRAASRGRRRCPWCRPCSWMWRCAERSAAQHSAAQHSMRCTFVAYCDQCCLPAFMQAAPKGCPLAAAGWGSVAWTPPATGLPTFRLEQPTAHPAFRSACVQPHHRVLDMCAAPGSKTFQLLEALHGGEGHRRQSDCCAELQHAFACCGSQPNLLACKFLLLRLPGCRCRVTQAALPTPV